MRVSTSANRSVVIRFFKHLLDTGQKKTSDTLDGTKLKVEESLGK